MPNAGLVRASGTSLMLGGALTALLNAVFTPFLPMNEPFEQTAASMLFLWRQSASAVAVALLLFGTIGLYLRQAERRGALGPLAFGAAFLGSALVLAWEWVDIFILRELALRAPDALRTLEADKGLGLYDLGAIIPITLFTLGWIAFAIWTLRAGILPRRPAWVLLAGIFLTPPLTAVLPGLWGGAMGNVIVGVGFVFLGIEVKRPPAESHGP